MDRIDINHQGTGAMSGVSRIKQACRLFSRGMVVKTLGLSLFILTLLTQPASPIQAQAPTTAGDVTTVLEAGSTARVVVLLQPAATGVEMGLQLETIAEAQQEVLAGVAGGDFRLIHQYQMVPGLVGEVTRQGLDELLNQPQVAAVALDLPVEILPVAAVDPTGAGVGWDVSDFTGAGVNVAVLDTGVDLTHGDLADDIVAQKCFSRGNCPPGNTNEGEVAQDEHGHGTHVAGIISGRGETSPRGIAPEAGLVVVRVLGSSGAGFTSDVIAGLDWVIANQARFNIKAINLSLGGGAYSGVCDEVDANTRLYAASARRAREAGITIFAASGNRGLTNQMFAPACIGGVISVGSTYGVGLDSFSFGGVCTDESPLADQVACISDSSPVLDLLAPGVAITSTALGGGQATRSGTSMSAAHTTAVAALMLQANPDLSPIELETILKETGVPVTDHRTGRVTPRVDRVAAVTRAAGSQLATISGTVQLQGRTDHGQIGIFASEAPCSSPVTGPPATTTQADGHFEITRPAADRPYQCLRTVHAGYLAGQHTSPQGNLGTITLPGGDVTQDGKINIFDLAFIAARFNSNDAAADINGSGLVDIFDLVIAAGNYNQKGPVSNWEE